MILSVLAVFSRLPLNLYVIWARPCVSVCDCACTCMCAVTCLRTVFHTFCVYLFFFRVGLSVSQVKSRKKKVERWSKLWQAKLTKQKTSPTGQRCVRAVSQRVLIMWHICMDRQMDEQTDGKTLKTCWLIICFSVGYHRGQKQPRNGRTDGRMDGQTLL